MIGKVIDNYTILEELGRGGMGVVYKAKEDNIRFVALKLISSDHSNDLNFLGFFEREARSMASLDHPNIIKLLRYRAGQYLVMDYVRGKTLEEVMGSKPMDLERVRSIFTSLLEALEYAHGNGVIHRDLKPANIMIREDGVVKVMDFGIAKLKEYTTTPTVTIGPDSPRPAPQKTTLRAFSPGYSPPEQELGTLGEVDARGDIYSLGVILFECMTGRGSPTKDRKEISVSDFGAEVPRRIAKLVMKATQREQSSRFQTAAEMLRAFKEAFAGSPRVPGRPLRLAIPLAAVVLVAALLSLVLLNGESPDQPVLTIESDPSGASIFFDNALLGLTPLDSIQVSAGEHTIGAVKEGFERKDTGFVAGQTGEIRISLRLDKAVSRTTLTVFSTPNGASAYLDGEFIGITPVTSYPAVAGVHRLRLEREGFLSRDSTLEIAENRSVSASLTMRERPVTASSLVLGAVPNGTVSVNGESRRVNGASGATFRLNPGSYSATFTHPEYGSKTVPVTVRSGESSTLICHFETQVSVVSVSSAGNPLPSLIVVNGKTMGNEAPAVIRLGPGDYRLAVAKDGYAMVEGEKRLTIAPSLDGQKEIEVIFTLQKL